MVNEMFLMKSSFFARREAKREKIKTDVSFVDSILKEKEDDLDAQYKRVFSIKGKMAQINIHGPLSQDGPDWIDIYFGYNGTAYKNIIRAAKEARELYDKGKIENVLVRMNTPGGTVDGIDHAYQALQEISDIGIVKNDGMVASGGVWLAMAFDRIEPSTDSAQIGSIGVVATFADYTGYYNNFGIQVVDITNEESPNKRPDITTKEGVDIIQRELNDLYEVFVSRVTASRPITKKKIDSLKGEMLIAKKAIDFGLMDIPLNEKKLDADFQANKEGSEVSNLETKTEKKDVITESVITEKMLIDAVQAERSRIYGLAKISGVEISENFKTAIDTGVELGKYAVEQVEAREAKEKAEIEAAKQLRDENNDQEISGIKSGDNIAESEKEASKLDKLLDSNFKKRGKK